MNIGIVGYSGGKFDESIAKGLMILALDIVVDNHPADDYVLVSGFTDMGIPAIAYREADKRGWKTKGIACKKAYENPVYDVDSKIIVGDDWGDESETFLDDIDVLVRIGGGKQSMEETKKAKENGTPVYEYDLPEKKG